MSPPPLESTPVVATGVPVSDDPRLPALNKAGHAAHCVRCLDGLPASLVEMDASRCVSLSRPFLLFFNPRRFPFFLSRMAISFYCLGTLDVTGLTEQKISPTDRQSWKEWIWDQYVGESKPWTPTFTLRRFPRRFGRFAYLCVPGSLVRH